MSARAQESLPRAQPALDESFTSGLGLGIIVKEQARSPPKRASERSAAEAQDNAPFHRHSVHSSTPKSSEITRVHGMPSLATVDRIVINDVLEEYKPGEESVDTTRHSRRSTSQRAPIVPPPGVSTTASFLQDDVSLSAYVRDDGQSPELGPYETGTANQSRVHVVGMSRAPTRTVERRPSFRRSMPTPPTNEIFPDGLFTSIGTPTLNEVPEMAPPDRRENPTERRRPEKPAPHLPSRIVPQSASAFDLNVDKLLAEVDEGDQRRELEALQESPRRAPISTALPRQEERPSASPSKASLKQSPQRRKDVPPSPSKSSLKTSPKRSEHLPPSPSRVSFAEPKQPASPSRSSKHTEPPASPNKSAKQRASPASPSKPLKQSESPAPMRASQASPSKVQTDAPPPDASEASTSPREDAPTPGSTEAEDDVDALLAQDAAPVDEHLDEDSVDKLLQEDGLNDGIARSSTMRRISRMQDEHKSEAPVKLSPPPDRLHVDLPTLPSWSPIMLDGLLGDDPAPQQATEMPKRMSWQPRISRDQIRERVERKKTGTWKDTPRDAPAPPVHTTVRGLGKRQKPRESAEPPSLPRTYPHKATVLPTKEIPPKRPGDLPRFADSPRRSLDTRPVPPQHPDESLNKDASVKETRSELAKEVPAAKETPVETPVEASFPRHRSPNLSTDFARQATWFDDADERDEEDALSPLPRASMQSSPSSDPSAAGPPTAFSYLMERELQRIVRESDQKYKIKERGVFADTPKHTSPELSMHPAWMRVHKPNELAALAEQETPSLRQFVPDAQGMYTTGRIFFAIESFTPDVMPAVPEPSIYCVLDNGIHRVKTASVSLFPPHAGASRIDQEFELIESPDFALTVSVVLDGSETDPMYEMSGMPSSTDVPRTSVGRFLSKHLQRDTQSRIFKGAPQNTSPRPETLGRVQFALRDVLQQCYGRAFVLDMPVHGDDMRTLRRGAPKVRGSMRMRLFYLPQVPLALEDTLPGNMDEAMQGMDLVAWQKTMTSYHGVLTQLGGDCLSWRRRPMRIIGLNLICYNEVTKRPTTRIDLVQAVSVEPCGPSMSHFDDTYNVPRSFCITFRDGEKIYLFADTEESMHDWMRILRNIITYKLTPPPAWALAAYEEAHAFYRASAPTPSRPASSPPLPPLPRASLDQRTTRTRPSPHSAAPPLPDESPASRAQSPPTSVQNTPRPPSKSPPPAPDKRKNRLRTVASRFLGRRH